MAGAFVVLRLTAPISEFKKLSNLTSERLKFFVFIFAKLFEITSLRTEETSRAFFNKSYTNITPPLNHLYNLPNIFIMSLGK